jgi:hypothetical protein
MKSSALLLWGFLVVYTLGYLFIFGFNSALLSSLLSGEADLFSTSFFNLMGLVPIYFLLDASLDQCRSPRSWVALWLGFGLGAYSTLWGYRHQNQGRRNLNLLTVILLGGLIIGTGWMYVQMIGFADPRTYFSLFFIDSLVGIMTVDFLVLYGWTILLAKRNYPHWWVSFLPMIGFGILMLWHHQQDKNRNKVNMPKS